MHGERIKIIEVTCLRGGGGGGGGGGSEGFAT